MLYSPVRREGQSWSRREPCMVCSTHLQVHDSTKRLYDPDGGLMCVVELESGRHQCVLRIFVHISGNPKLRARIRQTGKEIRQTGRKSGALGLTFPRILPSIVDYTVRGTPTWFTSDSTDVLQLRKQCCVRRLIRPESQQILQSPCRSHQTKRA